MELVLWHYKSFWYAFPKFKFRCYLLKVFKSVIKYNNLNFNTKHKILDSDFDTKFHL